MKILSIDSSAKSASVAITEDRRLISECFVNASLTHSRTLMPMVDNALMQVDLNINDIDAFCCNSGPGSFTGIRIGVAAVKGLSLANGKPCAGVSTLESIAGNFLDENCIVCSVMDARCGQVYNSLFSVKNGVAERICPDRAISISELWEVISPLEETVYLAGDGAELCFNSFSHKKDNIILASENRRFQRAYGSALAAMNNKELFRDSSLLAPVYLRLPQAERELKLKKEKL